ncbi:hypothetical protein EV424DRAFT_1429181 [Suillus variegatus]|nr:hypothetical protein EV424DRAFT_1429181 [Suillus variegatus]
MFYVCCKLVLHCMALILSSHSIYFCLQLSPNPLLPPYWQYRLCILLCRMIKTEEQELSSCSSIFVILHTCSNSGNCVTFLMVLCK